VRAIAREKTGYAYSDEITLKNIELSAKTARAIRPSPGKTAVVQAGFPGPSRVISIRSRSPSLTSRFKIRSSFSTRSMSWRDSTILE
jgi:predicted Zn-dependent protease